MAEIRTVNRVVMRYILDHQEYNFSLHDIFGKLNFKEDTVSSSLRYEDEPNFYLKSKDKIKDDKASVDLFLSKLKIDLGSKIMNDFLFIYPNIAWSNELGKQFRKPIKVENVKEVIQIT